MTTSPTLCLRGPRGRKTTLCIEFHNGIRNISESKIGQVSAGSSSVITRPAAELGKEPVVEAIVSFRLQIFYGVQVRVSNAQLFSQSDVLFFQSGSGL